MTEETYNPSGYDMPRPTRMVIVDDLIDTNTRTKGQVRDLGKYIDSDRATIVTDADRLTRRLRSRYDREVENGLMEPLDLMVGVGSAGQGIAYALGINSPIVTINPTRVVGEDGMPIIVSKTGVPLEEEFVTGLKRIKNPGDITSIGIVDDTVFFGGTAIAVRDTVRTFFPDAKYSVLALNYVAPFVKDVITDMKIVSGLKLTSDPNSLKGINTINADDFINREAIRLSDGTTIPFAEEENWMRAWFGENYEVALYICGLMRYYYFYGDHE